MSSRVDLTPTRAVFTYSFSDFRYDEEQIVFEYFDFMFYMSNWGTKRILIKIPEGIGNFKELKKYNITVETSYVQEIRVYKRSKFILIDINFTEEEGLGWIDENQSYGFESIRREIIEGDYRALFMIWLRFIEEMYENVEFDKNYSFEVALIPANLETLPSSVLRYKDFFGVSDAWLNALLPYSKNDLGIDYGALVENLSKGKMIKYVQMILDNEPNVRARLLKELKLSIRQEGTETQADTRMLRLVDLGKQ